MRYNFEGITGEPTITVSLKWDNICEELDLIGTDSTGAEWIIASFTKTGTFTPNKSGLDELGLKLIVR